MMTRHAFPRVVCGLIALVLFMGSPSLSSPAYGAAGSPKVHPVLSAAAGGAPDRIVDVLVQIDPRHFSAGLTPSVGAKVKKQWRVTPTLHVELPAGKVAALANLPGVKWVTPNAATVPSSLAQVSLKTVYPELVQARPLWTNGYDGTGIGIAVLDSGTAAHPDLQNILSVGVGSFTDGVDRFGHGTHVAGMIAGRNDLAGYVGVAPASRIISVKVLGDDGVGHVSDLLDGLEWVHQNRGAYNIRVVNISLQAATADSYRNHPVNAAVEALWLNGVVVVAAAGNHGASTDAVSRPPANDPYIITVGALDDNQTLAGSDDSLAGFSGRGTTLDGYYKPEVVAPGRRIASLLAPGSIFATNYPDRIVDQQYITMSGTSMATPVVAGSAALLLQAHPGLSPDQVKWLLVNTAKAYTGQPDSAGLIDAAAALSSILTVSSVPGANQGLTPAGGVTLTASGYSSQVDWDEIPPMVEWDEIPPQAGWDEVPALLP